MENIKILEIVKTILVDLVRAGKINCKNISSLSQAGVDDSFSDLGISANEMVTIFSSIKQRFWEIDGVIVPTDCLIKIPMELAEKMRIVQDLLTAIEREIYQNPLFEVVEGRKFNPLTTNRALSCPCGIGQ